MDDVVRTANAAVATHVRRIATLISVVYGAELNDLVDLLAYVADATTDGDALRMVYLVCLDAEPSLQRYERSRHAGKYAVFAPLLRRRTEEFLDHAIDLPLYVEYCCDDYVLS